MKNTIILIFLLITLTTYAQRNSGVKFGSNISWTSSTRTSDPYFYNYYELVPSFTYHLGYSWNIKVVDKFSIQTDLIYNWKGSSVEIKDPNAPIWFSNNYNELAIIKNTAHMDKVLYFSMPIMVNYMITSNLFVELGGETSLALTSGDWNTFEFGLSAGMGYSTNYGDISVRYTHGVTPYEDIIGRNSVNESGQEIYQEIAYANKYRTFQLSLTIPIFKHLKRK